MARIESTDDTTNITDEVAIFAGGCFWCMVEPFYELGGVVEVTSGYTGGAKVNPTYEDVTRGDSGHYEAIKVKYNPTQTTYTELLDTYFRQIDPTDGEGQFGDRGDSYKPAIFYTTPLQKELAEEFIGKLDSSKKFDKPIAVAVLAGEVFYKAEENHQDYYKKEPDHYKRFKKGSGREAFINENWKR